MQTTPTTTATSPANGSPLGTDDPRTKFAKAVDLAGVTIAAVRPEQLDGPTPCAGFDVRRVLGHLVEVLLRVAALGRGESPFAVVAPEGVADDGWVQVWTAAAHDVQSVWSDDAVLQRDMTLPWIQAPGATILVSYLSEVTVHTWDLATATGQLPEWDHQVLEAAFRAITAGLPAGNRAAMFEAVLGKIPPEQRTLAPPFGEVVPVDADAPLIDRLVAWTGRRP